MKYRMSRYLLLLSMVSYAHYASAISTVYNFRIAQITKQPIMENQDYNRYTTIALLFDQYYNTYDDMSRSYIGGLAAFIYNFKPYYFRNDFAVSNIRAWNQCSNPTFAGTEVDDILFTLGRNFLFGDRKVLTISGLFGIPTHPVFALQHPAFGYGQVGLGIQLDGSYPIRKNGALLAGGRYIRFIKRYARDDDHNLYLFSIGNVEDILIAYKHSWPKHGIEAGYTSRVQFGASIYPALDDTEEKTNYVRSSFYAVYKYKFKIRDLPSRLLFNIAYGRDHLPHTYGNKYILTFWTSFNINF